MAALKIKIELKSDLCSYSGEVYNTTVDTDVVYDNYGIPYIPAKRIKGCIRESALELKELGLIDSYDDIFGKEGDQRSLFTLSNAKIENYDAVVNAIKAFPYKEIVEPQKVLKQYTYVRTQTSVDPKTGSAIENTLRTTRVVKKGQVFYAECDFEGDDDQLYDFKKAVSIVKHMGVSRSRGLGLVNLTVETEKNNKKVKVLFDTDQLSDNNEIEYTIKLESPIICKSSEGNQAKTIDYIDGSKVLGLIAGSMGKDGYRSIMNDITVSNAYISCDNKRTIPGRNSWQKVKNQKYEDGEMTLTDMIYFDSEDDKDEDGNQKQIQRTPANIRYISEDSVVTTVDTEISYHHKRPEDKSLGHATATDGEFYQLGSICEGQVFKGYIRANREVAKKIHDSVSKLNKVRIGYGKSSEFGQVEFTFDSIKPIEKKDECIHKADLLLVSDTILYNDYGMLVADIDTLQKYLRDYFNCGDITIEKPFLSYSTIGGYNVTWKSRKPIFTALSKGSVMRICSGYGFDATYNHHYFLGERTSEGYGEFLLEKVSSKDKTVKKVGNEVETITGEKDNKIIEDLLNIECKKIADEKVREVVQTLNGNIDNSALSKIRLLFRSKDSFTDMYDECDQLNSSNKDKCLKLLEKVWICDSKRFDKKDILDQAKGEIQKKYCEEFIDYVLDEKQKYKFLYDSYITELKNASKKGDKTNEND